MTNFTGMSARFMAANRLGPPVTDSIDALDVAPFQRPEVFDWWVRRFNMNIVFHPAPGRPPNQPANDLHEIPMGSTAERVFDLLPG